MNKYIINRKKYFKNVTEKDINPMYKDFGLHTNEEVLNLNRWLEKNYTQFADIGRMRTLSREEKLYLYYDE